jgi:hypothetical protein
MAGMPWRMESALEMAKGECGLDDYETIAICGLGFEVRNSPERALWGSRTTGLRVMAGMTSPNSLPCGGKFRKDAPLGVREAFPNVSQSAPT